MSERDEIEDTVAEALIEYAQQPLEAAMAVIHALAAAAYVITRRSNESRKWRSIDSAPKDGSNIILAWLAVDTPGGEPHWFQTIGCWDDTFSLEWDDDAGKSIYKAAWTDYTVASWADEEFCELHPTHWAPLLPAPDEKQEPHGAHAGVQSE